MTLSDSVSKSLRGSMKGVNPTPADRNLELCAQFTEDNFMHGMNGTIPLFISLV